MDKIKALIVDDSRLMQEILKDFLTQDHRIEVVATASDPYEARDLIKQHNPQVITLDVEMPKMNGIEFLKNLMRLHPLPVVMVSNYTQKGAVHSMKALQIGAIECVSKPNVQNKDELYGFMKTLQNAVINAANSNIGIVKEILADPRQSTGKAIDTSTSNWRSKKLIAIGASTGGVVAINYLLENLTDPMPPIVIAQHMTKCFTQAYCKQIEKLTTLTVTEAMDGEQLQNNHIYIAPGANNIKVISIKTDHFFKLLDNTDEHHFSPNIDILFNSLAEVSGVNSMVAMILTGMGSDGALGLKAMRDNGCITIAQDRESSAIWGMPKKAIDNDAASQVLSLNEIAKCLHMPPQHISKG